MIARDLDVVAGAPEGVAQLAQRGRPEGVAHLGAVDRDLRDRLGALVEHVLVVAAVVTPLDRPVEVLLGRRVLVSDRHRGRDDSPQECPESPRMLLDNWLAQRAETCPDRIAVATADGSIDYAALEAEAASLARRLAAKGVRRDSVVALALPPGIEYVAAMHALMKLGATAFPLDPRLGPDERAAAIGAQIPALVVESADGPRGPRGRPAAARRGRPRRAVHPDPDQRDVGQPDGDRAQLRQPPLERRRLRVQPRRRPGRPLALLRAAVPRLGRLDPAALGDLRHDRGGPRRLRPRPRRRVPGGRRDHDRLPRHDDADPADRRRRRDREAPGDPGRRRARSPTRSSRRRSASAPRSCRPTA